MKHSLRFIGSSLVGVLAFIAFVLAVRWISGDGAGAWHVVSSPFTGGWEIFAMVSTCVLNATVLVCIIRLGFLSFPDQPAPPETLKQKAFGLALMLLIIAFKIFEAKLYWDPQGINSKHVIRSSQK